MNRTGGVWAAAPHAPRPTVCPAMPTVDGVHAQDTGDRLTTLLTPPDIVLRDAA